MSLINILEVEPDDLAKRLKEGGQPSFRLDQILAWVWQRYAVSFDEMTNLPKGLINELEREFVLGIPKLETEDRSKDNNTVKYLLLLEDGARVECVSMRDDNRYTFCVSSQVGCPLACQFCATGAGGFVRNLSAGEILGQIIYMGRGAGKIGNIVFMGMGEPLLNINSLEISLKALADERRVGLGERRVTVSTAGITPGIRRLAEFGIHPNLALSLNSPFNDQRSALMPVNKKYPLNDVLSACEEYVSKTGRRLLLEYVMLGGVNTSEKAAREVARIARSLSAIVNMISFNPINGSSFRKPSSEERRKFKAVLKERGIETTERFRRGGDIGGGCGQLSGSHSSRA